MKRKFHRRHIAFDNKEAFLNFVGTYDFLFSNGGAHTNRMFFDAGYDIQRLAKKDALSGKTYYVLTFICDRGTWNYIRVCHKFDRVSIWYRVSSILSPSSNIFRRSYVHYVEETDES